MVRRTSLALTKYCVAKRSRLPARNKLSDWKAQRFSSNTWKVENRVPADAKPTIAASWIALHIRSNTESLAKRMSNKVICSQVNHITPRKPMYAIKALPLLISCVAVNVERFATKKRSKKSSMGVASGCRKNRGFTCVSSIGLAIHGKRTR